MGGEIWVESEAGKGAVFSFTLVAKGENAVQRVVQRLELKGKRVLVVDDLAVNRKILKHQLESQGMTVVGAASGMDALELLTAQEKFDVAILDMHMPEMDGIELATRIRALAHRRSLPLIMLSSMGQRDNADGLFAAVLTKPAKEARLFDALSPLFGAAVECKNKDRGCRHQFRVTLSAAHLACRRQRHKPESSAEDPRANGLPGRCRFQWQRSGGGCRATALRCHLDGRADAGDGRGASDGQD